MIVLFVGLFMLVVFFLFQILAYTCSRKETNLTTNFSEFILLIIYDILFAKCMLALSWKFDVEKIQQVHFSLVYLRWM